MKLGTVVGGIDGSPRHFGDKASSIRAYGHARLPQPRLLAIQIEMCFFSLYIRLWASSGSPHVMSDPMPHLCCQSAALSRK